MIFGTNTTSDISKLLYVISLAVKRVKFETILKYHKWYLYQISHANLQLHLIKHILPIRLLTLTIVQLPIVALYRSLWNLRESHDNGTQLLSTGRILTSLLFQPRPQGFSLKKWVGHPFFNGKVLGTRLL